MRKNLKLISLILIFSGMLLIGLSVSQDYGLSTDEEACHFRAVVMAKHISDQFGLTISFPENTPLLSDYPDRDHGVLFDLFAYGIERLAGIQDSRQIFLFKHTLNFLVFFAGLIALYQLVTRRFKDWRWGLLGSVLLFMSPRIFADAFYNAKDLVFMVTVLIAMNTAAALFAKPTPGRALIHGLATAAAVATRVMGIVLIPLSLLFLVLPLINQENTATPWRKKSWLIMIYLVSSMALTILFWPTLWSDPYRNFLDAFQSLSRFERWSKEVLLMGHFYPSTDLPWFFSLVWIAITTPLLYLGGFLIGLYGWIRRMIYRSKFCFWRSEEDRTDTFSLALFWGPLISVILFNSILYDGWRQLYFTYPALLIIALSGFYRVAEWLKSKKPGWRNLAAGLVGLSLVSTSVFMIQSHPLQMVYFNQLAHDNWRSQYDLDYWGLSNREALEFILAKDDGEKILISQISAASVSESFRILKPEDRSRLDAISYEEIPNALATAPNQPLYVFNNYKRLLDPDILDRDPNYQLFYEKKVAGETILKVYQRINANKRTSE